MHWHGVRRAGRNLLDHDVLWTDRERHLGARCKAVGVTGELETAEPRFVPTLAANSIEAISLRLLNAMSGPLVVEAARRPAAPSVGQLGRVEAYLVANFAEPVSVEKLAEISGVSVRSVFAHFLSRYGCTPEGYLLPIRLEMARLTLRSCHDRDAIGAVALQCGFHSLRQFEHAYRNRFGAMPSADLP